MRRSGLPPPAARRAQTSPLLKLVSRKSKEWNRSNLSKNHRLTRLDQRSGKKELCSQTLERLLYQIKLSHRYAAGKQQHVRLEPFLDQLRKLAFFIWSDGQLYRLAATFHRQRCQRIAIAVPNLAWSRLFRNFHQFISGGKDSDARLAINLYTGLDRRRSQGNLC